MPNPRMCPHCRAFIDQRSRKCEYCGEDLPVTAAKRIRREERLRGLSTQLSFTTLILLLLNVAIFVASWILSFRYTGDIDLLGGIDAEVLHLLGAKFRFSITMQGEWWRVITANFLHGGLLHLAFNTMSLFNLAPLAEQLFGTSRFIVIYFFTGIFGFVASTVWTDSLSIGASASICGLVGALYAMGRIGSNSALRSLAQRWIIGIAIFGFLFPAIDNAAHLGGLVCGFVCAYVSGVDGRSVDDDSLWAGMACGMTIVVAIAFFLAYRSFAQTAG